MRTDWLTEAVLNNAHWCDAVAVSHGIQTRWESSVWSSNEPMPRFYPNIITLRADASVGQTLDAINADLPSGWGIKDSFAELELAESGFALAFNACWYCCPPDGFQPVAADQNLTFNIVQTDEVFDRWVAAWGEGTDILRARLLENDAVELAYVERDGDLVAGVATNLSGTSIGISNAFGPTSAMLACLSGVAARDPSKGIVGYGSEDELSVLSSLGFRHIGDLRVWVRV